MTGRKVLVYYAWSRPGEIDAPLWVIDNRFPTLFETRRMAYPKHSELADAARFDQSIAGFLDHVMKRNFVTFIELARALTRQPVEEIERVSDDKRLLKLDRFSLDEIDTLIVISFDSIWTGQEADRTEIEAVRTFLAQPGNLAFICPHHDIGEVSDLTPDQRQRRQIADFMHHGDKTIPPQQGFGAFARSLLEGLGVPVENLYGLRPSVEADGSPSPIEVESELDRFGLLNGVRSFNLHPHLPHLERMGRAATKLDVLVRQKIDLAAPPHPFLRYRNSFDALLQSKPDVFPGALFVADSTLWSSTAGGFDSLLRFWTNVLQCPRGS